MLPTPPTAVGDGVVCGVAADRLLNVDDHVDVKQFTSGASAPQDASLQDAIHQYLSARSDDARQQAASLIVGQCSAYGFYMVTYESCIQAELSKHPAAIDAVRACIADRTWTVYTQQ